MADAAPGFSAGGAAGHSILGYDGRREQKEQWGVSWPPSFTFRAAPTEAVKTLEQSGNPKKRATEEKCSVIFNNECSIKIVFRDYFGVAL